MLVLVVLLVNSGTSGTDGTCCTADTSIFYSNACMHIQL